MSNTKYFLHHVLLYINYETYTLVIPSEKTYPPPRKYRAKVGSRESVWLPASASTMHYFH